MAFQWYAAAAERNSFHRERIIEWKIIERAPLSVARGLSGNLERDVDLNKKMRVTYQKTEIQTVPTKKKKKRIMRVITRTTEIDRDYKILGLINSA